MAQAENVIEAISAGNELMVEEDYDGAVVEFTKAIEADGNSVKALVGRAQAYLKLKKNLAALDDCNKAIAADAECEVAYFRKGLACFEEEEFETALAAFKKGKTCLGDKAEPKARPYTRWIRKCETEIDDSEDDGDEEEDGDGDNADVKMEAAPAAAAPPLAPSVAPELKYQFYQTVEYVTVTILEKKVKPEEASVTFGDRTLVVEVTRAGAEKQSLELVLFDTIEPTACTYKVFGTKIEVKLKKGEAYTWNDLVNRGETRVAAAGGGELSTSSATPYASKRDWGKVDQAMKEELEKDKPEGEEALNDLFKSIYGKASDDTRRAMNKSFQTSGGIFFLCSIPMNDAFILPFSCCLCSHQERSLAQIGER